MMAAMKNMPGMQLNELLHGVVDLDKKFECFVQRLVLDSRQVQKSDLFIAVPGHTVDGRQYIDNAIQQGASVVLWQTVEGTVPIPISWRTSPTGDEVPVIAIQNLKDKVGILADRFYREPSKSMCIVGITGTNGKTSCSHFIAQALSPEMTCGVIGTMGWGFINNLRESSHTTPDAITCHDWLADMKQSGASAVAMEISSHALDQGRVNGVAIDCAVFTNLSHEHLDYHGDMANYGRAKANLFHGETIKKSIINQDDDFGRKLLDELQTSGTAISYGLQPEKGRPDMFADNIESGPEGISALIHVRGDKGKLQSQLYGLFNIYNLLATLGVLLYVGLDFKTAMQRINSIKPVPGRMQVIRNSNKPVAIIDYAHTPDALEQVLESIKQHGFKNIWCVFGCGGDRDKSKRPLMGSIAESYADRVIVTNDNPRNENEDDIINGILSGIKNPGEIVIERDRKAAIQYAISNATEDDVVLIAGKGHENYQIIGKQKMVFSDFEEVSKLVNGGGT